jgi:sporulation protein YlmC with PRC-barrel domain
MQLITPHERIFLFAQSSWDKIMTKKSALIGLCFWSLFLVACASSSVTAVIPSDGLADYRVVDPDGQTIAELEDVLISADDGQISYALVILQRGPFSYGKAAFIGAAVPRTAVPWDYFTLDSASEELQLNVDDTALYAAPRLREKPDQLETDWDADIRAYWQAFSTSRNQE